MEKKGRGRPVKSNIRQNIVEVLFYLTRTHGYDICKTYLQIFPKVTIRAIYYNLNKGIQTGEFIIDEVVKEMGDYSWGTHARKTYYRLGPNAKVFGDKNVSRHFGK